VDEAEGPLCGLVESDNEAHAIRSATWEWRIRVLERDRVHVAAALVGTYFHDRAAHDQVAEAFRRGGGVRPADLHPDVWAGTSRFTAQWHQNMLVQQWLPLVPQTTAKLHAGARVADVGCGTGQALIALARAFPAITATGYDVHPASVEQARRAAAEAGLADRVTYHRGKYRSSGSLVVC
jgi:SAM-dependent methyltransferase